MDKGVAVLLTAAVGGLIALQAPINAGLREATGGLPAALVSFSIGTLALAAIVVLSGKAGGLSSTFDVSWYYLLGGLLGADHRNRDQRVGHVDGAEQSAEQVVPADVEGRAEPARLAAEHDDRGQGERPDREGDEGCRQPARGFAQAGVDRRLQGDQAADGGGEQDGDPLVHPAILSS